MTEETRYRVGHDAFGPVFAAFARLLLLKAQRDDIRRLAFVARDGDFLMKVTERFIARSQSAPAPALDYVHLSRISTSLAQHDHLDQDALREVSSVRAGPLQLATILRYYNVDVSLVREDLERHRLGETADIKAIAPLLSDLSFQHKIRAESQRQKQLLADYLRQRGLVGDPHCALVDVGWRGSIPSALRRTFGDFRARSYYVGYWHELGRLSDAEDGVEGLLADFNVDRTIVGGAAYYASFLFESICRAAEGTVLGYQRDAIGVVTPVLADDPEQREIERAAELWRDPIRRGICDYVDEHAARYGAATDWNRLRRDAQRHLFRVAFFPSAAEIETFASLSHTEGHAKGWGRPLIDSARPSPFAFRRWLGGLTSPWRAGYVMATGGRPLASMYVAIESLLIMFPRIRRWLRRFALAISRQS